MAADPDLNEVITNAENGRTATRLELHTDAAAACLLAWVYPADTEARQAAAATCRTVSVDYIESVAKGIEACDAGHADPAGRVRWLIFMACLKAVMRLSAAGAVPREDILATGKPANELGFDEDRGTNA